MFNKYLPGILLSHYIWPHHYRQLQFFNQDVIPNLRSEIDPLICDIGPGTGFYSRQVLENHPNAFCDAYDISEHSLSFSQMQVSAFGVDDRFSAHRQNILTLELKRPYDFLLSVEVLEHLEDPLTFIKALRRMLKPGGRGMITAAVTAANLARFRRVPETKWANACRWGHTSSRCALVAATNRCQPKFFLAEDSPAKAKPQRLPKFARRFFDSAGTVQSLRFSSRGIIT